MLIKKFFWAVNAMVYVIIGIGLTTAPGINCMSTNMREVVVKSETDYPVIVQFKWSNYDVDNWESDVIDAQTTPILYGTDRVTLPIDKEIAFRIARPGQKTSLQRGTIFPSNWTAPSGWPPYIRVDSEGFFHIDFDFNRKYYSHGSSRTWVPVPRVPPTLPAVTYPAPAPAPAPVPTGAYPREIQDAIDHNRLTGEMVLDAAERNLITEAQTNTLLDLIATREAMQPAVRPAAPASVSPASVPTALQPLHFVGEHQELWQQLRQAIEENKSADPILLMLDNNLIKSTSRNSQDRWQEILDNMQLLLDNIKNKKEVFLQVMNELKNKATTLGNYGAYGIDEMKRASSLAHRQVQLFSKLSSIPRPAPVQAPATPVSTSPAPAPAPVPTTAPAPAQSQPQALECPVCMDPTFGTEGKHPVALPCGHLFHEECVKGQKICPVCRKPFEQAIKLYAN